MRKVKERRPQMTKLGLALSAYAFFVFVDLALEPMWIRQGLYAYPGAIRSWSIFPGTYYQFPIYEAIIWPTTWTVWACLRHFRNDKGETFVERGMEKLRPGRRKTFIRFLALTGFCDLVLLLLYFLPMNIVQLHGDPWPADVQKRSYLTNHLCGPGTTYACGGANLPIPRPDSAHISPEGELVVPAHTKWPPAKQTRN
jgi:hypothetical protein